MKPTLLVLAAGMGSRYGGLKQLDHIGPSGETIMDYSIYDAINAGFGKVVFVIRKSFEKEFIETFVAKFNDKIQVELAYQELDNLPENFTVSEEREKPWGTGHAIWVAKDVINEPFAVVNADDYYGREAFAIMSRYLGNLSVNENGKYAMCGYKLGNTLSENGSVSRGICSMSDDCLLTDVTEHTNISKNDKGVILSETESGIHELDPLNVVSMNFWGFTPEIFNHLEDKLKTFLTTRGNELKSEIYIPFVVDELMKEEKAEVKVFQCNDKWFGVTYKEDKDLAISNINTLIEEGRYSKNLWLK